MSLLQAFSVGMPAIVTEVGGMAEVVHIADAGITVPVSNQEAMTAAMVRLASDSEEREFFARNAEGAFSKHFTLESMVEAYMELYRNTPRAQRRA